MKAITSNVVNPKNVTLQMIAYGKIDYAGKEAKLVANKIINENMEAMFEKFRRMDLYANESVADLLDTVVNFSIFNAEIILYVNFLDLGKRQFFGMKKEETLLALYVFAQQYPPKNMNTCKFKIRGIFSFNDYLFHQCFAKGRISIDELIYFLYKYKN